MRRREFITVIGGAAAWPLAAHAQQGRVLVVGVLRPNRKDELETFAEPFRRYMKAIGWEEGRNIHFLFVWTEARSERAPALPANSSRKMLTSLSPSAIPPSERRSVRPGPSPS
jgi:putative ABC transport system substrate-binding protein